VPSNPPCSEATISFSRVPARPDCVDRMDPPRTHSVPTLPPCVFDCATESWSNPSAVGPTRKCLLHGRAPGRPLTNWSPMDALSGFSALSLLSGTRGGIRRGRIVWARRILQCAAHAYVATVAEARNRNPWLPLMSTFAALRTAVRIDKLLPTAARGPFNSIRQDVLSCLTLFHRCPIIWPD
jgi:hypothetical protein